MQGVSVNEELQEETRKYFQSQYYFFRYFWANKSNLALHMGFWEEETRNLHEALLNENKYVAAAIDAERGGRYWISAVALAGPPFGWRSSTAHR